MAGGGAQPRHIDSIRESETLHAGIIRSRNLVLGAVLGPRMRRIRYFNSDIVELAEFHRSQQQQQQKWK